MDNVLDSVQLSTKYHYILSLFDPTVDLSSIPIFIIALVFLIIYTLKEFPALAIFLNSNPNPQKLTKKNLILKIKEPDLAKSIVDLTLKFNENVLPDQPPKLINVPFLHIILLIYHHVYNLLSSVSNSTSVASSKLCTTF